MLEFSRPSVLFLPLTFFFIIPSSLPFLPSCYHLYGRLDCFAAVSLLFTDNDLPPWKENKAHRERVVSFSSHLLQSVATRYQEFSLEFFLPGCSRHSKIILRFKSQPSKIVIYLQTQESEYWRYFENKNYLLHPCCRQSFTVRPL